jgi:DNA-binding transcriptional LysR family regulator
MPDRPCAILLRAIYLHTNFARDLGPLWHLGERGPGSLFLRPGACPDVSDASRSHCRHVRCKLWRMPFSIGALIRLALAGEGIAWLPATILSVCSTLEHIPLILNHLPESWPGLSRPSTSCLLKRRNKDVDARDKRGHDAERWFGFIGTRSSGADHRGEVSDAKMRFAPAGSV